MQTELILRLPHSTSLRARLAAAAKDEDDGSLFEGFSQMSPLGLPEGGGEGKAEQKSRKMKK